MPQMSTWKKTVKGLVSTGTFLKGILNKEFGLRDRPLLSHVAVFETADPQRLVGRRRVEKGVGTPVAVTREAAPTILARLLNQPRPQGIRFDVPKHRQQVFVVLDHGALEPPLPHVPAAAVEAVVAGGKNVTYDMKADRNDPTAVGTREMAAAICRKLSGPI